jgi:hypothetical protein
VPMSMPVEATETVRNSGSMKQMLSIMRQMDTAIHGEANTLFRNAFRYINTTSAINVNRRTLCASIYARISQTWNAQIRGIGYDRSTTISAKYTMDRRGWNKFHCVSLEVFETNRMGRIRRSVLGDVCGFDETQSVY